MSDDSYISPSDIKNLIKGLKEQTTFRECCDTLITATKLDITRESVKTELIAALRSSDNDYQIQGIVSVLKEIGETGDVSVIPAMIEKLESKDNPKGISQTCFAIAAIGSKTGDERVIPALVDALCKYPVNMECVNNYPIGTQVEILKAVYDRLESTDDSKGIRSICFQLANIEHKIKTNNELVVPVLVKILCKYPENMDCILYYPKERQTELLREIYSNGEWSARLRAIYHLGDLAKQEKNPVLCFKLLIDGLSDVKDDVRTAAFEYLCDAINYTRINLNLIKKYVENAPDTSEEAAECKANVLHFISLKKRAQMEATKSELKLRKKTPKEPKTAGTRKQRAR
ncbi:MAG: HEAT repeat domain-containing protein [Candidatus Micrarchaeota archaeon]|nr:HEAT repeat domain-containing protein [Candidatus Micrarchaeota archaeon]